MKFQLIFFFLLISILGTAQNQTIEQLKAEDKIVLGLYFYPSTLRMLNIQQDTAFNKFIKGVEKLSFYNLDAEKIGLEEVRVLITALEEQELYEAYMNVEDINQQMHILGKETGEEWMIVALLEDQMYLTYVKGKINWLQLHKIYEAIATRDTTKERSGFGILLDYLGEDQQRRKDRKEREIKRVEKDAAKEMSDSLENK